MSLTTSSADEQSAMGNIIRRVNSQRIVGEHEKDLELLLGLICYLACRKLGDTRIQFHKTKCSPLIMWTQVAIALVLELGIHRLPPKEDRLYNRVFLYIPQKSEPMTRTKEERRALLGTFICVYQPAADGPPPLSVVHG
ncbi:unnamed protein product [Clonostachys chloroleuca]|uniref:Uncharacterized protein n=1 Tax=Clonostachys chloroleuca TaxID=1926264 RepID=A0AA35M3U4_9HYPO|nr:unnamed protein product [Clonostachys chloroleuca]